MQQLLTHLERKVLSLVFIKSNATTIVAVVTSPLVKIHTQVRTYETKEANLHKLTYRSASSLPVKILYFYL